MLGVGVLCRLGARLLSGVLSGPIHVVKEVAEPGIRNR